MGFNSFIFNPLGGPNDAKLSKYTYPYTFVLK